MSIPISNAMEETNSIVNLYIIYKRPLFQGITGLLLAQGNTGVEMKRFG